MIDWVIDQQGNVASEAARQTAKADQGLLIYFGPDITDPAVIRRVISFQRCGFEVTSFSFRRIAHNQTFRPSWFNVSLGTIKDRAYLRRIGYLFRALGFVYRHRDNFASARVIYARNLDLLFLAIVGRWFGHMSPPIVYEVLDVAAALNMKSTRGRILRTLERIAFNHIQIIVTSSPAFVSEYFQSRQGYTGTSFVLENKVEQKSKLPPRHVVFANSKRESFGQPWTIGWFGTLGCRESLKILLSLAEVVGDKLVVYIRGYPRMIGIDEFSMAVSNLPNVVFDGEYKNPDHLAEMYARIDFTWCFDFRDPEFNSKWALPNRLYEGGYFGVPALAAQCAQTGAKVDELGMGWTFKAPYVDSIAKFLRTLTTDQYDVKRKRIRDLPTKQFYDPDNVKQIFRSLGMTV